MVFFNPIFFVSHYLYFTLNLGVYAVFKRYPNFPHPPPPPSLILLLTHHPFLVHLPSPTHSGLEFIYAQSLDSMKGLLIGLFYLIFGAFNAVETTIFKYLEPKIMWFYGAVLIICVLGLLVYIATGRDLLSES